MQMVGKAKAQARSSPGLLCMEVGGGLITLFAA